MSYKKFLKMYQNKSFLSILLKKGAKKMIKFTKNELIEAVRQDLIGELEAINQYQRHIDSTDNETVIKVLTDIKNEEQVHVGELLTLLAYLDENFAGYVQQGEDEVKEMLQN